MSHIVGKSAYKKLEERLNRFPQGAPPSETLYQILSLLFSEKEAELVSQLPIKPFTVKTASRIWKLDIDDSEKVLDELAGRAILFDSDHNGMKKYTLPPPMAGFFEFSMMRTREDLDQKLLSELFYQYLNVEDDFVKDLFLGSETLLGRTFVQEEALSKDNLISILDYEKASHIIETASSIGISMCYCRHKREHLGKACNAPMDICMTFNNVSKFLIKHNYARRIEASECMELLHKAYEYNLVQCGENVRNKVSFICNCCGCCCEFLVTAKKIGIPHPVQTTSYIPRIDEEKCSGCGKCVKTCPISAIEWVSNDDGTNRKLNKKVKINEEICLGCGVCVRVCSHKSITLERRKEQVVTPVNSVHRIVLMAIEKGKLQELIFDNQAFGSHQVMAAMLSVILKLPPVKRMMASKQMKSVYLDRLLDKI
ncbi:MAG TPA: 4Fe-4S dicluster domain-containing protein [Candidatus Atribacteria bacterium]|nr:4Fe-4S dicluster domain-containing protein [Candidatus Atribacteria bacterium]